MLKETIIKNPKYFRIIYKVYYYYNYFRNKQVLNRYKELENKYQGNRCFVIGNGPSLNKQDLTKLADEYTFVCNYFCLIEQFEIIKPKFYTIIEPIKLNILFRKKEFKDLMKDTDSYSSKNNDAKFFFNIQYKDYISENKLFQNKKQVYYFQLFSSRFNGGKIDFTKAETSGKAVIYFNLFMAKYLGFKKIYLIGCDHDYDNILRKNEIHFYKDDIISSLKKNTSNSMFAKKRLHNANYDYLKNMDIIYNNFKEHDIEIFNAGIGGKTDTFPRINYNSLFKK